MPLLIITHGWGRARSKRVSADWVDLTVLPEAHHASFTERQVAVPLVHFQICAVGWAVHRRRGLDIASATQIPENNQRGLFIANQNKRITHLDHVTHQRI